MRAPGAHNYATSTTVRPYALLIILLGLSVAAWQYGRSDRAFDDLTRYFQQLAKQIEMNVIENQAPWPVKRAEWTSGGKKIIVEVPREKNADGTWQAQDAWEEAFRDAVGASEASFPPDA